MEDNWENPYEEDGVTLGPEEALLRETEKTKALKVEKLQLKDTIEKLKIKNDTLAKTNQSLEKQLISLADYSESRINFKSSENYDTLQSGQNSQIRWSFYLLIFNLISLTTLLFFLLKQ
tara:strand:- start:1328 stop:1684 length:357 start_codon:yes stop_codon:yes gene_type:complete